MTSARRPRVVVVEQMELVAETFGIALGGLIDAFAVVVQAESTTQSIAQDVGKARPDVVFVNCELGPHVDCAALVDDLAHAGRRVVVLTDPHSDVVVRGECLRRGAVAAVCKADGLAPIMVALKRAVAGGPVMDPGEARHLIAAARNAKDARLLDRRRLASLTRRERAVLKRLMAGASAGEIARSWCVSESTVRSQIKSILLKLEVSCQIAAVAIAHRNGWTMAVDEEAPH